jgi:hypothetical protein
MWSLLQPRRRTYPSWQSLINHAGAEALSPPGRRVRKKSEPQMAAVRPGSERGRSGRKAGVSDSKMWRNMPRSAGEWSSRKRRRKAGDERTARREARQVRAARTRAGREGRRRNISRRRSSPRADMVVGAAGGDLGFFGSGGGGSHAMARHSEWVVSTKKKKKSKGPWNWE